MPYADVMCLYQLITVLSSIGQDNDMPLNPIKHKYKQACIYTCAHVFMHVHMCMFYIGMCL
jgi:hypothetical protein